MQRKRAPLAEIVDVYGLRIIVDSVDTCYRALGVVHSVYKPMPGRFKDYIAIPRVNGYQSLHTTLFGPNGVPIEVQIRTGDMDRVAESGIAAHWKYKEHAGEGSAQQERARAWLTHLMEMQESGSSEEFIESVKVDLFPDKVYVFTPKGDILRLPRGATVVDFAYAVHTDVGNRCVAAKVDRRLDAAAHGAAQRPDRADHHRQGRAPESGLGELRGHRQGAHRHPPLPEEPASATRPSSSAGGCSTRRWASSSVDARRGRRRATLQAALERVRRCTAATSCYEKIGLGERLAPLVARRLLPGDQSQSSDGQAAPLAIAGTEGLLVTYARCCYPIPGDPIIAFLTAGRGIVIHRETCGNVEDTASSRRTGCRSTGSERGPLLLRRDPRRGGQPHGQCWRRCPRRSPARTPTSAA